MDKSSQEIQLFNQKRLIEELTQGQELANKLKVILDKPYGDDKYSVANDLLAKILSSFTVSISMMNQKDNFPASSLADVTKFNDRKEDSHGSSKTSVSKNRRGCYKKRKKSHISVQIIPQLIDDGHAWRKYGQKVIQNSQQPRNYFRCTHKFDQGCQATKQVQKTEDEPPMYHITYHEKHTCKNQLLNTPQIIFDTTNFNDSKCLISFDPNIKLHESPTFPNFHTIIKEEHNSITDRHVSPHELATGSSEPMSVFSSGSDCGDVMSYFSATSAPSYEFEEMDIMEGLHGFSDKLELEFQQYFDHENLYHSS